MEIPVLKISKYVGALVVIFSPVASALFWIDGHFATKKEITTMSVEIRLQLTASDIRTYHDKGLTNLTDAEKHKYDLLIESEKTLTKQKNELDGIKIPTSN